MQSSSHQIFVGEEKSAGTFFSTQNRPDDYIVPSSKDNLYIPTFNSGANYMYQNT